MKMQYNKNGKENNMNKKYKYHSATRDETAWIEHPSGGEVGDLMDITDELNRLQNEINHLNLDSYSYRQFVNAVRVLQNTFEEPKVPEYSHETLLGILDFLRRAKERLDQDLDPSKDNEEKMFTKKCPQYVYELADTTDEEIYFPYGLFATAEDALDSVQHKTEPPTDNPEEHVRLEIRKRPFGKLDYSNTGKTVKKIEWFEKWTEDGEDTYWEMFYY